MNAVGVCALLWRAVLDIATVRLLTDDCCPSTDSSLFDARSIGMLFLPVNGHFHQIMGGDTLGRGMQIDDSHC